MSTLGSNPPRRALSTALAVLAGLLQFALAGCTGSSSPTPDPFSGPPYTLHVLASSELADMAPILRQATSATGVKVDLTLTGSLTGAQQVIHGTAELSYNAVWFASDNYLDLYPDGLSKLNGTTETMSSPVILGVRSAVARRLGWDRNPVTWTDIAKAAAAGKFTFGMTDPAMSNSGLSALVAVATGVAGHGAALRAAEIPRAEPELAGMFQAQVLTAPTSGTLTQMYLRALSRGNAADGLIDYESQLLTLQAQAPRADPITLVYPSDGVLEATYPLSVLTSAPPAARSAYQRLARYLTSTQVQRKIMRVTHRRPIAGSIPLAPGLAGHQPFELPFPASPGTVQDLIEAYHGTLRTADSTVYVLDISGSMRGARLAGLKRALLALAGVDSTLVGSFSMFRSREQVTFLPFGTTPSTPTMFDVPASSASGAADAMVLRRMRGYIDGLHVHGHTAIYDALVDAYRILAAQNAAAPGRIESIVLLTDGENNTGRDLASFLAYYRSLPPGSPAVYTIAFGQADLGPLAEVANVSGGTAFDAVSQPVNALGAILQAVRGYQ